KYLRFQEMKLRELIEILREKPDHMYYMASHPFRKTFPNLRADLVQHLYIGEFERETFSPVDIENPDFKRFPKLREATPYRVIIEPGESLHIPRNWCHCVISMDVSISISSFFITYPQLFSLVPEFFGEYIKRAIEGWRWKGMR
ncbi:cupin-like domain-containing protein, partial [Paraburkholderia sp. BCC1886]|uniref:cupin-like domain-containing protein n=1 Tax=Paraburkholderia sp. BCC1886 TaxID=2562670 RepID=UPI0016428968